MSARQFARRNFRAVQYFILLSVILIAVLLNPSAVRAQSAAPAKPPVAPVRVVTDEYFGVKVGDPYRYFENLQDPEVASWFKTENDYARQELNAIPGRAAVQARIKVLTESSPA